MKTSQDQQQEAVHRTLQAKDATFLQISATTGTICLRRHNNNARNMYQQDLSISQIFDIIYVLKRYNGLFESFFVICEHVNLFTVFIRLSAALLIVSRTK